MLLACNGERPDSGVVDSVTDPDPWPEAIEVHPNPDLDGDGYGLATDCDDTDRGVNPGAEEVWYDGVDQDCDGRDDDQDLDGYELAEDCDDTDPAVYPGATETRYDHVDQDCGGDDDWDADGDGDAAEPRGGDCDDGHPHVHPGAPEWCDPLDHDCNGKTLEPGLCGEPQDLLALYTKSVWNEVGEWFPRAATNLVGDLDGDGAEELVTDCRGCDPLGLEAVSMEADLFQAKNADYASTRTESRWRGLQTSSKHWTLTPGAEELGDWNGDGLPDVALSAVSIGSGFEGAVWIVTTPAADWPNGGPLDDVESTYWLHYDAGAFGTALAPADYDGDGLKDLAVGLPNTTWDGYVWNDASLYLLWGREVMTGRLDLEDEPRVLAEDPNSTGYAGYVQELGDLDGDGHLEVAANDSDRPAVHILSGVDLPRSGDVSTPDITYQRWEQVQYDKCLLDIGDIDEDGYGDFLVSLSALGGNLYVITGCDSDPTTCDPEEQSEHYVVGDDDREAMGLDCFLLQGPSPDAPLFAIPFERDSQESVRVFPIGVWYRCDIGVGVCVEGRTSIEGDPAHLTLTRREPDNEGREHSYREAHSLELTPWYSPSGLDPNDFERSTSSARALRSRRSHRCGSKREPGFPSQRPRSKGERRRALLLVRALRARRIPRLAPVSRDHPLTPPP